MAKHPDKRRETIDVIIIITVRSYDRSGRQIDFAEMHK